MIGCGLPVLHMIHSIINCKKDLSEKKTNLHCIYGEKNITKIPFKTDVSNVILFHHEHADGIGPLKKWNEIPLFARIIQFRMCLSDNSFEMKRLISIRH